MDEAVGGDSVPVTRGWWVRKELTANMDCGGWGVEGGAREGARAFLPARCLHSDLLVRAQMPRKHEGLRGVSCVGSCARPGAGPHRPQTPGPQPEAPSEGLTCLCCCEDKKKCQHMGREWCCRCHRRAEGLAEAALGAHSPPGCRKQIVFEESCPWFNPVARGSEWPGSRLRKRHLKMSVKRGKSKQKGAACAKALWQGGSEEGEGRLARRAAQAGRTKLRS